MRADLPNREPGWLKHWRDTDLTQSLLDKGKGKPTFLLHDGPPYANGVIHMGHALNKVLKDFVVKYKTMMGFRSPYKPGWDTHGLPIEHQLFKTLKKSKHDVSRIELREKATAYALDFVEKQKEDFVRLGVLGDWDHPYITLTNDYEASIVEIFLELQEKGFIYRKLKPGYWCAFDETALAEAEVEYADKSSDSVFVRFQIDQKSIPKILSGKIPVEHAYVLIWTTTPWTLPANVGLAFHPDEKYTTITDGNVSYIVAEKRKDNVLKKLGDGWKANGESFNGSDVVGLKAVNPIHQRESVAVTASYVTMEDGTGIVHIAPGHGMEDFDVGLRWKLDVISPVDERGEI